MFELEYKAKASSGWDRARRAYFLICIDNLIRPEKMVAAIEWMNQRFDEVVIDIADSLKRYYYIDQGEKNAYDAMIEMGDAWIRDHQFLFDAIRIQHKTVRWDDWLNLEEYPIRRQQIVKLYQENGEFRNLVHQDIADYRRRHPEKCYDLCVEYMYEELTKDFILGLREKAVWLYDGSFTESTKYLMQHFPMQNTLVRMNFNRRKAPLALAA